MNAMPTSQRFRLILTLAMCVLDCALDCEPRRREEYPRDDAGVLLEVEDADFRWCDEEVPFAGSNMNDEDDDALMLLDDDDFGGT